MDIHDVRRQAQQLAAEVKERQRLYEDGDITRKNFEHFVDDAYQRNSQLEALAAQLRSAGQAVAAQELAMSADGPRTGFQHKMIGNGPIKSNPLSPMDLTDVQLKSLWRAMETRTPMSLEITTKAASAPVLESGLTGGIGQLPPIIVPNRFMSLPYEPSRISQYLPSAAMSGPSAVWLTHTANAQEVVTVGEGAPSSDIGPTVIETQAKPTKIQGMVSTSLEAWQDYSEFGQWLPTELTRSLINSESNMLLNAGTSGGPTATFHGLLATSGTLTRTVASGETPLDAINQAFVDIRVGPAFAEPDLMIIHPATNAALRRQKDSQGRYILGLLAGPLTLTADGSPPAATPPDATLGGVIPQGTSTVAGNLWGVPIVESTQCPAGTAVIMSVRAGAALFYVRLGMVLQFNMFGDTEWVNNLYSWRIFERIALATPRPEAINILTGLPTN